MRQRKLKRQWIYILSPLIRCAVPMDIVEIIFAPGEIPQIAIECMKLAGYMGGVEAVKN